MGLQSHNTSISVIYHHNQVFIHLIKYGGTQEQENDAILHNLCHVDKVTGEYHKSVKYLITFAYLGRCYFCEIGSGLDSFFAGRFGFLLTLRPRLLVFLRVVRVLSEKGIRPVETVDQPGVE